MYAESKSFICLLCSGSVAVSYVNSNSKVDFSDLKAEDVREFERCLMERNVGGEPVCVV